MDVKKTQKVVCMADETWGEKQMDEQWCYEDDDP